MLTNHAQIPKLGLVKEFTDIYCISSSLSSLCLLSGFSTLGDNQEQFMDIVPEREYGAIPDLFLGTGAV